MQQNFFRKSVRSLYLKYFGLHWIPNLWQSAKKPKKHDFPVTFPCSMSYPFTVAVTDTVTADWPTSTSPPLWPGQSSKALCLQCLCR